METEPPGSTSGQLKVRPAPPVRPTDLAFDMAKMSESLVEIQRRMPLHPQFMQLALTHGPAARTMEERAYDGLGSLFDFSKRKYKRHPMEFVHFNPDFQDLYFYELYQRIQEWSQLRLGRVRLMLRPPSSCYSMHADESMRYHVAVASNPECYFFFKGLGLYRIPLDGRLYYFDATKTHTGFNAGPTPRIHLVFDTIEWCSQPTRG